MNYQKLVTKNEKGNPEDDPLTREIIGAAIEVHKTLGPGLLERTYEICMLRELELRGLKCEAEKSIPLNYKGITIENGYRVDLVVEDKVVVELKSVQALEPIHEVQLVTYLKLSGHKVGLLINFNVVLLKDGIKRRVV